MFSKQLAMRTIQLIKGQALSIFLLSWVNIMALIVVNITLLKMALSFNPFRVIYTLIPERESSLEFCLPCVQMRCINLGLCSAVLGICV